MTTTFLTADAVDQFIVDNMMKTYTYRGDQQEFLPRGALDQITTREVISLVAIKDKDLYLNEEDLERFIDQVHQRAPKLFATCFFEGLPMSYLKGLLDHNISDANFPLTESHCTMQNLARNFRRVIGTQKKFFVPYLRMNGTQVLDNITKPIHFDEREECLLGRGAFGNVYEVAIHKDHRSFSCGSNSADTFAMKVTMSKSREPKFHDFMAELDHPHLLKCLASYTASSQYHMIYEKADKDLEKLMMECNEAANLTFFSDTDLAGQLHGLVGALSVVHNQENIQASSNTGFLDVPHQPRGRGKSGYIHDIKPDNILVFIYEDDGKKTYWFRLSDYSSANVVDLIDSVSGNRVSRCTSNRKCTPDYRAPEYLCEEGISRPFDLWSLGCVFLELLVWFTEDFGALEAFRNARFRQVKPGGIDDQGFWYTEEEGKNPTAHVREVVIEKMAELADRCRGGVLEAIADIIPELLDINPRNRPTANDLLQRLDHLAFTDPLPFDYEISDSSLILPDLATSSTLAYDSDSDSSGFSMVKITGATQ